MGPDFDLGTSQVSSRSHWIRLRTLIFLRWLAVSGQLGAIAAARYYYDLDLNLGLCYLAIGTAIIANLIAIFIYPENKRLSEHESQVTLLFDLAQLSFLLYLTGGLSNPFALLLMAPVSVAATALRLRSTLILGGAGIVLTTFLAFVYIPLRTEQGILLELPPIFRFGFWVAIVVGISFMAIYARRVSVELNAMSDALLATQMALAREQKLTDLGGVVAAAAHELGTPLATIKLVSAELIDELSDHPDLKEDAMLIRDQADRCRDILRSMGRAGNDDPHMRRAPLESVIREAAEPHQGRGKDLHFDVSPATGGETVQPIILRQPEIIHGLRNLVQNGVDFAKKTVWIEARWNSDTISIRIVDDGKGFPSQLIGRIGDPFMSTRRNGGEKNQRPGYDGMGLGLFIAKTLLERTGAEMTFTNIGDVVGSGPVRSRKSGALVEAVWKRDSLSPFSTNSAEPLGKNEPIPIA
ncbi:sensor histidine kinase RegB [Actibacterium sp. 188UL27-1]|uniref:sensor histidine kinase RegB n=1 Tax=Actibacterium sp. 188UL27-1 TaxID=2786961 RepID=UPI00195DFB9C|nr:ActS/PrrB/RegB family redox-sensitive histidine kinase [Actibacterium sp. 188UL27-1]MBM7067226.1 ActS/PrrB/RegB family redox-sensitive histidine kinase [Actibacterium sp. 188UL27-1]